MKVAVVGSGVSGLAATWLLNEHSDHEVHLYESDSRPGGHANTVHFIPPGKDGKEGVDVDTGFIVFNPSTYPNFINFLKAFPKIRILKTEMTFSVSRDRGRFEWAGNNLFTVFCQVSRLLDPDMWRLIYDVLRFNACARRLVMKWNKGFEDEISIGEYLRREGYSESFTDNYLIPMTAAIWSTPPDRCALDFPARTLLTGKPSWLTIEGGSKRYVESILSTLPSSQLHLSTAVEAVSTDSVSSKVRVKTADGQETPYDHVVLACHSDTSLRIIKAGEGVTELEEKILGRFDWNRNQVYLHSDTALMPKSRLAWTCWNYITTSTFDSEGKRKANSDLMSLSYGMNDLQHISEKKYGPVLVTMNPPFLPRPELTAERYYYDHPVLDSKAVLSQQEMSTIQNTRRISYAGAYLRYGFHEDGFTSGLNAVLKYSSLPNVKPPFEVRDPDREPGAVSGARIFDVLEGSGLRAIIGAFCGWWIGLIRLILRAGGLDLSHIGESTKVEKARKN